MNKTKLPYITYVTLIIRGNEKEMEGQIDYKWTLYPEAETKKGQLQTVNISLLTLLTVKNRLCH